MTRTPRPHHLLGSRWAWVPWLTVLLGIWEIAAPWIWGYAGLPSRATLNDVIVGGLVFAASLWAAGARYSWPSWWNVLFGIWLLAAPFLLHYTWVPHAEWNDVIVGLLVIILGAFTAFLKPQWRHPYPNQAH